jgi:hypothetical protein
VWEDELRKKKNYLHIDERDWLLQLAIIARHSVNGLWNIFENQIQEDLIGLKEGKGPLKKDRSI